jgi:hypothetical protein
MLENEHFLYKQVSTLPNGIYLLEIQQAGEKITEKIIVQH